MKMNIFIRKTASILLIACMLLMLFGCGTSSKDTGTSDQPDPAKTQPVTESAKPDNSDKPDDGDNPGDSGNPDDGDNPDDGNNPEVTVQEMLLGTWIATVDVTDGLNRSILQGMGEDAGDMSEYIQISKFDLVLIFTFRDDGTYSISIDETHFKNSIEDIKEELKGGLRRYLEDMLAAQGVDMSLDDLLAEEGTSLDALMDESLPANMFDGIADEFTATGNWKAESGKLYSTVSVNDAIDESNYSLYEITSDGIKLSAPEGVEDGMGMFPMILIKAL